MTAFRKILIVWLSASLCLNCFGQTSDTASVDTEEAHTIILSPGRTKPLAFLYAASARADVRVGLKEIEQTIQLQLRIVQGDIHQTETVSLGLGGSGEVMEVQGESVAAWAVRTENSQRYLDLQLKPTAGAKSAMEKATDTTATIRIRSEHSELPAKIELAHLMPGKALGFDSQIQIQYVGGVAGKIVAADGFAPLVSGEQIDRLQTATGGRLALRLDRSSALPPAAIYYTFKRYMVSHRLISLPESHQRRRRRHLLIQKSLAGRWSNLPRKMLGSSALLPPCPTERGSTSSNEKCPTASSMSA